MAKSAPKSSKLFETSDAFLLTMWLLGFVSTQKIGLTLAFLFLV